MSDSTQLVPANSTAAISAPAKSLSVSLVPANHLARLIPTRVVQTSYLTVYWFERGTKSRMNPHVDCAMLTIRQGVSTFDLSYYPTADSPQIVQRLELTELGKAIDDLVNAGFSTRKNT